MIEMTRLRLINWHNFQDDCIPFRMVTYLIVGKTTIMDAIRYCLTTNKDFNAAGNRKSTRTLQGSVHGKQRGENSYLRPGHTVSYVGVEFIDHERNTTFVISVRVESESPAEDLRHVSQDWFITKPGTRLEDLLFVDQNRRPSKKEAFKASGYGMRAPAQSKGCQKVHMPYPGDRRLGVQPRKEIQRSVPYGDILERYLGYPYIYLRIYPAGA